MVIEFFDHLTSKVSEFNETCYDTEITNHNHHSNVSFKTYLKKIIIIFVILYLLCKRILYLYLCKYVTHFVSTRILKLYNRTINKKIPIYKKLSVK